jgi:predicted PurR-regulated permease PerM
MNESLNTTRLFQLILILLLLVWCFLIIQPFVLLLVWAIILAVALFPVYHKLAGRFTGGKRKRATFLFTLVIALVLFVPGYYLVSATVKGTRVIVRQLEDDALVIPKPDPEVADWPFIGDRVYKEWKEFSDNAEQYAIDHKELLLDKGSSLLGSIGGFLGSLLLFIISFFIAVALMYNADKGHQTAQVFMKKMMGSHSEEILVISRDTIRGVVKGILLVAIIQAFLALVGFTVAGIPVAGVWAFLVLVFAVVQLPVLLIMIPPIMIAFSSLETTPAIILTVYLATVALSDSILKPILMGKGLQTPVIIILIGSIGGMLLHGIIGLFVGAVVLAVAHRLYSFWIHSEENGE